MKKYSVLVTSQASLYVDVEAESEEEARMIAEDRFYAESDKTGFSIRLENTEVYEGDAE